MGRQDECQPTGWALGRQPTHPGTATGAAIAFSNGLVVASAVSDASPWRKGAGGKPHHEQAGCALFFGSRHRGGCGGQEKLLVVNLVHGNTVL